MGADVSALVTKQLQAFKQTFARIDLSGARTAGLSPYDVIVIASMVEREASARKELPLVASVIYNRLKAGMPLGIDATTRFLINDWTHPLTASELAIQSPYNTRIHAGLPPGPIGSPGIAALEAAANPANTDYLYYVANATTPGTHCFTASSAAIQHRQPALPGGPPGHPRPRWLLSSRVAALYGVLGSPVAHSRSPAMMAAAFAALGVDARYFKLPVPPELFEQTVRALPESGYRGANVTIPHKGAALAVADLATRAARAIGAANTLTLIDGRIEADNTDAPGLLAVRWRHRRPARPGPRRGRRGAGGGVGAPRGRSGSGDLEPDARASAGARA